VCERFNLPPIERRCSRQPVLLFDLMPGVSEAVGQVAVVGEEEEARGIAVETSDRMKPLGSEVVGHKVEDVAAAKLVRGRANDARGLVEHEIGEVGLWYRQGTAVERE